MRSNRYWMPATLLLTALVCEPAASWAQQRPPRPPTPVEEQKKAPAEEEPFAPTAPPILVNICPKFVLIGTPRRIRFFGAYLNAAAVKYEEKDLDFRDYRADADGRSFSVVIEAKREAGPGKRSLALEGAAESGREVPFYVLKREDRALLQRDLQRCPEMKDEVEGADPKKAAPRPKRPPTP